jgi:hypothetical protein
MWIVVYTEHGPWMRQVKHAKRTGGASDPLGFSFWRGRNLLPTPPDLEYIPLTRRLYCRLRSEMN